MRKETWKIDKDESGNPLLIIPDSLKDEFAENDIIEFSPARKGIISFKNLTCITITASRLRRNLNSIWRNLSSDENPLSRVIVTLNGKKIAVITEANARLTVALDAAIKLFEGDIDAAREWLNRPARGLGDRKPIDMIQSAEGADTLLGLIGRLEHDIS
ncbi:MAG: hypothetical protein C9356_02740 [Oleiphilus sp.]|nr:MAG: hypothetical protein C9356_02740 [Oleiphilus sp.]